MWAAQVCRQGDPIKSDDQQLTSFPDQITAAQGGRAFLWYVTRSTFPPKEHSLWASFYSFKLRAQQRRAHIKKEVELAVVMLSLRQ